MSDYRRLVAYIYLYNQGKRVKNVGFTKVESRNGECRIQIQIKGAWVAEGNACKFSYFLPERRENAGASFWERR